MLRRPGVPLLIAVFMAVSLRMLIPIGWMPAQHEGPFALEPCPAEVMAPMMHGGANAGHHDAAHKDQHSAECSFSPFHSGLAAPFEPAAVSSAIANASPVESPSAAPVMATAPPALPPPSTGPPALA